MQSGLGLDCIKISKITLMKTIRAKDLTKVKIFDLKQPDAMNIFNK